MINDFFIMLYWWLLIFGLGFIFLPLTFSLFPKFIDRGYILSKIIGVIIISYLVWILGSLKILPFSNETIWLVIFLGFSLNFWLFHKQQKRIKKEFHQNLQIFAIEEILFFSALVFWSYIRGFQPDIQGLEKFMDYGFVNSILRSRYFPPADMWLAGETINYYYFGHLVSAVLTKLSNIDSAITYNLLIASLFAFTFGAAFSFGVNLLKNWKFSIVAGLMTAFLVSLGSNLHPLWWFLKYHNYDSYWYPDATRFIVELFGARDNTIHEFPIYSFVVADLHGHLLNLPFVLLFISLLLSFFYSEFKLRVQNLIFSSLLLGLFYMTNAWDFATYNLVFGAMVFLFNFSHYKFSLKTISRTASIILPSFFGSLFFSLPFHLNFKNLAMGIALADFHSPIWMLLVLWGFPLIITLSFCAFSIINKKNINIFILTLLLISWLLVIFPEFLYVKDIYIHSHQRANTMFKLTYQSFVMFYLVAFWIFSQTSSILKLRILKIAYAAFISFFLFFIFIYPYFAIRSYYGLKNYYGLYGLNYLKNFYPQDYEAILWLKKNIVGQPTIVEAVGESYTDFARVSTNTGLPTILGWRVHEWLWRGSFDEAGKRTEEVREIYESEDIEKTKEVLNKYKVIYLFVGELERQAYPNLNDKKFAQLGEIVFHEGKTKIYKLN